MYSHEELISAVRAAGRDGKTFTVKDVRNHLGFKTQDKKEISRFRRRLRAFEKVAGEQLVKVGNNSYRLRPGAFEQAAAVDITQLPAAELDLEPASGVFEAPPANQATESIAPAEVQAVFESTLQPAAALDAAFPTDVQPVAVDAPALDAAEQVAAAPAPVFQTAEPPTPAPAPVFQTAEPPTPAPAPVFRTAEPPTPAPAPVFQTAEPPTPAPAPVFRTVEPPTPAPVFRTPEPPTPAPAPVFRTVEPTAAPPSAAVPPATEHRSSVPRRALGAASALVSGAFAASAAVSSRVRERTRELRERSHNLREQLLGCLSAVPLNRHAVARLRGWAEGLRPLSNEVREHLHALRQRVASVRRRAA